MSVPKAYVSDCGLPKAVATKAALPTNAYVGHTCYVEAVADAGLYVYNGSSYDAVVSSGDSSDETVEAIELPVYATVGGATNPLPLDVPIGSIAYVSGTSAVYVRTTETENSNSWQKLNPTADTIVAPTVADTDHYPSNPSAGQMVWLTGTGLMIYNGTAWKAVTIES